MTVMTPSMLGISTPKEVKHLYKKGAVSLGDGLPVVTEYPQFPLSGPELVESLDGDYPKHCETLQNQYPNYFSTHCRVALNKFLGGRRVYKMPKGFV